MKHLRPQRQPVEPLLSVLAEIAEFQRLFGMTPSRRELATQFGRSGSAAQFWVNAMVARGWVKRPRVPKSRALTITAAGHKALRGMR